jgi:SAM-dependent methyltransferase
VLLDFPVYFRPLEDELVPVLPYLKGAILNAGCGERDISGFLSDHGATVVDHCDIQSSIPGAILCDLCVIPKPESSYDGILCNAVLEHVAEPEAVMLEFFRLLKDNGYLVISVPFLQPYHPTPTDFRRYTQEGIIQLAERTGFRLIEIRAIHSWAQTIGWIIWAALQESGNTFTKALLWLPLYIMSRLCRQGKVTRKFAANSFQAVLQKKNNA